MKAASLTMNRVEIQMALSRDATVPEYATQRSAGVDLRCAEEVVLAPMERRRVWTGVRLAIPDGFEGQVRPRSGLALTHGLGMVNAPGTIDSDYRGEIGVVLINFGQEEIRLQAGERIAQLVICPIYQAVFRVVERLDDTPRGEGGFGSTGT
jgi:dUTP pyrophosphatase